MSRGEFINFEEVVSRLKEILNTEKEAKVASALGIKPSTLSERKKRGSLPYEHILRFCEQNGVSLNWIFWGKGPRYLKETEAPLDTDKLVTDEDREIFSLLEKAPEMKPLVLELLRSGASLKESLEKIQEAFRDIPKNTE